MILFVFSLQLIYVIHIVTLLHTDEEAETFGHAGEQHGRSDRSHNFANVLRNWFTIRLRISLVILYQNKNIVDSDSQHQEGNHLNNN